eukprot:15270540-Heterocapsa_arctica.AAC.1
MPEAEQEPEKEPECQMRRRGVARIRYTLNIPLKMGCLELVRNRSPSLMRGTKQTKLILYYTTLYAFEAQHWTLV